MSQPSLFDQDCQVCGAPLRGRAIDGAHLTCAHVRELRELKDAVRALAPTPHTTPHNAATVPHQDASAPHEETATESHDDTAPAQPPAENPDEPHATAEEEPTTAPCSERAPTPAEHEPHDDPASRVPVFLEHSTRNELADYTGIAVIGPGWVQIGNTRWAYTVTTVNDIVRIRRKLTHASSAPQIWMLGEVCLQLGLETYPDDVNVSTSAQIDSLKANLAELPAAAQFMSPAYDHGWASVLEPWTLLRSDNNTLTHLVLEPYVWVYDQTGTGVTGVGASPRKDYPYQLDGTPQQRSDELISRIQWLDTHLGVLPDSSAGRTLERVQEKERKKKIKKGGPTTDKQGRIRNRYESQAGTLPEMDGVNGLDDIEPELFHPRVPTQNEIDRAEVKVEMDQRAAYPASFKSALLGLGQPSWVDGEDEAAYWATDTAHTFGVWCCRPRTDWHEPRLFPVHPRMTDSRGGSPLWVMGPTLDIACDDEDKGGAGMTMHDFGFVGAWIWPDAGHLLEPLYNIVRPALQQADTIEDETLRGASRQILSSGYKAFGGRLEYVDHLNSTRPWRYQPMWRRSIIATTRARLYRQVAKIARDRDLYPVHSVTDSAWYLTTRDVADAWQQQDNGNLGRLRPKTVEPLTEEERAALSQLPPGEKRGVARALSWSDE